MSQPQWNPYKTYKIGDVIQYGGIPFKSLVVQRGVLPLNNANWENMTIGGNGGGDPATLARILEFLHVIDESIYFEGYGGFGQS